jgi:integrase
MAIEAQAPARTRYQRGSLKLEGKRWILRARRDELEAATGAVRRVERRVTVGTLEQLPTAAQARRAADRLAWQLNPIDRAGRTISLTDFADVYLTDAVPMMKLTSGLSAKAIVHKHLVPFFSGKRLDEISGRLPQQFVTHLVREGLKRKTVRNAIAVLSRMLDLARQYGYQAAPLDHKLMKLPPDELDTVIRFFTPLEAMQILEAAEGEWRACFALLAYLGLRAGEVLGLTWSHIDLVAGLVRVRQAAVMGKIQTVKSRNSKADLPMPDDLRVILGTFREAWRGNDAGLLFADRDGAPLWATNVRRYHFYPLLKRLGIRKGGLHAFRHGHATNLFASGTSAPTVRGMLRHGDLKTTLRYTHVVTGEQRTSVEASAALLQRHAKPPVGA